ncbi:hypothetical protein [Natronorubrum thiooxidans]|uniref:Uncharacterized protein n=1 Tax=Natronorubrum thiooxidans TaxID=308853 RepID=A0A1N7GUD3_9EURY|nr:hypothetical protein [Natronorubrum thiooxidans]SIS16058.1 hypothetical protein SAMN05421752_11585 [Natronorubrum thiooxidans]
MKIRLVNHTPDQQLFRFAVETTAGLEGWESHGVEPSSTESVTMDLAGNDDPVAIHGVVDDQLTSEMLFEDGGAESDEICPYVLFEYGYVDEPPSFQVHTAVDCDW